MAFDLRSALTSFAPALATMLGGPLAGTAVQALESALGLAQGAGIDGITTAMSAGMTPESVASVRAADQRHAELIAQQGIDLHKLNLEHEATIAAIDAANIEGARRREVDAKDTATPRWLAFGITGGFFGILGWMLAMGKPAVGGDALLVMLGSLGTGWASCVSYYFGSSAGSSRKSELLAASTSGK
jgi:hypothetical protein